MANKKVKPLTDTEIKTDWQKVLEVHYTINLKPKQTTIGTYPAVSLKDARAKRDELKSKILNDIDPIQEKKEAVRA